MHVKLYMHWNLTAARNFYEVFPCIKSLNAADIQYCDKEMENNAVKKKWDSLVFLVL